MKLAKVVFTLFASLRPIYAAPTHQNGHLRSNKDDQDEIEDKIETQLNDMIHGRRLDDLVKIPSNIEDIHQSHPDVYQRIIDYSPVFDFDTDSCLPAAAFTRTSSSSNQYVQNQGEPVGPTRGITENCRLFSFMNYSNTYHRWNRFVGRDAWEFHIFALYL